MRKLTVCLVLFAVCLSLMACGNQRVEDVERRIAAIGTVTLESEPKIAAAEAAYGELSSRQKERVVNYYDLINARSRYDDLYAEHVAEQQRLARLQPMQEFAEKLFLDYASYFTDALTIEMLDAWVYCEDEVSIPSLSRYSFTFYFEIDTKLGLRRKVYYGASSVGLSLEGKYSTELRYYGVFGSSSDYWREGEMTAMQKGEKLDSDAIWNYFLQNYNG